MYWHGISLLLQEVKQPLCLDLSDDEDLAQAFDMHSLIVSSLHPEEEDKILTADEVISEIDDMMKVCITFSVYTKIQNKRSLFIYKI